MNFPVPSYRNTRPGGSSAYGLRRWQEMSSRWWLRLGASVWFPQGIGESLESGNLREGEH
jgi:hypothetical protein